MYLIILLIIILIMMKFLFNYKDNFNNLNDKIHFNNKYFDKYFNDTLTYDNPHYTYYYNDSIDQSKISENDQNIINQIDNIDYGNIKSGIQKCNDKCNGKCHYIGYNGIGICDTSIYSKSNIGTLHNNPIFVYGN